MVSRLAPAGAIRQWETCTVVSPTMKYSYWVSRSQICRMAPVELFSMGTTA